MERNFKKCSYKDLNKDKERRKKWRVTGIKNKNTKNVRLEYI